MKTRSHCAGVRMLRLSASKNLSVNLSWATAGSTTEKDIGKALEEAKRALETAKTMNMSSQNYDPLSVLQLLLTVKDTQEAHDFLQSLCGCHQTKGFRGKFKRDIDDHGVLCGPFRQLSGSRS